MESVSITLRHFHKKHMRACVGIPLGMRSLCGNLFQNK